MKKEQLKNNPEFEYILSLIQEAKNRVYAKANSELVLLYFNVGKIVSDKVNADNWGDNTVQELASFIASKQPELSGFNRRGLYRMKQFYETYSNPQMVSLIMNQLQLAEDEASLFVSEAPIKSKKINKSQKVSTLLTQIQWSSHLHILNKTKTAEEKIFYITINQQKTNLTKSIGYSLIMRC